MKGVHLFMHTKTVKKKTVKKKKKIKKTIITIIIILVILILIALVWATNFLINFSINADFKLNMTNMWEDDGQSDAYAEYTVENYPGFADTTDYAAWLAEVGEEIYHTNADDLKLHAYKITNETPSNTYALVLHGYTGYASQMAEMASKFYDRGFNILMPDAQAHGTSDGQFRGMGWLDRLDAVEWINLIIEGNPDAEIILYGVSMGGAEVMMISGEDLPNNVKLAIEDCGYTSVREEFAVQMKAMFGLPSFPFMQVADIITNIRAGYTFTEASAIDQVAKCEIPMLFIHGEDDDFVPYFMLDKVYEAANCPKEKLSIPGAGHGLAAAKEPERYWNTIDNFLDTYMPE